MGKKGAAYSPKITVVFIQYLCLLIHSSDDGPCLGSRKPKQPYEWLSYKQVLEKAEHLGSAFLHRGHSQKGDPHVGIFSQNRPEVRPTTSPPRPISCELQSPGLWPSHRPADQPKHSDHMVVGYTPCNSVCVCVSSVDHHRAGLLYVLSGVCPAV